MYNMYSMYHVKHVPCTTCTMYNMYHVQQVQHVPCTGICVAYRVFVRIPLSTRLIVGAAHIHIHYALYTTLIHYVGAAHPGRYRRLRHSDRDAALPTHLCRYCRQHCTRPSHLIDSNTHLTIVYRCPPSPVPCLWRLSFFYRFFHGHDTSPC
jgi:hypothetical protein